MYTPWLQVVDLEHFYGACKKGEENWKLKKTFWVAPIWQKISFLEVFDTFLPLKVGIHQRQKNLVIGALYPFLEHFSNKILVYAN